MEPKFYVDITLREQQEKEMSIPVLGNKLMPILHGLFARNKGAYALALPGCTPEFIKPSRVFRVFGGSRSDLECLKRILDVDRRIRDYFITKDAREVPDNFDGPWIEYRRYRPSNKNAERKPDGNLRNKRMQFAKEMKLPYFQVRSHSSSRVFSCIVQPISGSQSSEAIEPDSYGLSVVTRSFSLPHLALTS